MQYERIALSGSHKALKIWTYPLTLLRNQWGLPTKDILYSFLQLHDWDLNLTVLSIHFPVAQILHVIR